MNDCRHVVDFFEELAALYNVDAIDLELASRFFPDLVLGNFAQYWWLLHEFRDGRIACLEGWGSKHKVKPAADRRAHETAVYGEWEALARNMLRDNSHHSAAAGTEVWTICLPGGNADRAAYRELTKSLRRKLTDLHGLEAALKVDANAQPAPVPTNVLCIPPWQADAQVHLRCQRLAGTIRDLIAADPSLNQIKSKLPHAVVSRLGGGHSPAAKPAEPAKRPSATKATKVPASAPRGQNKAKILGALKGRPPMTASEIAKVTGISTATVSTSLTKMAKTGDVAKAERGYTLPQ